MKTIVLLATLVALSPVAACSQAAGGARLPAPDIGGIRAHLFQNKTGTLSDDVLAPGAPPLWNSFAGPGASNATLVVVEVTGPPGTGYSAPGSGGPPYAVRLLARETGRAAPLLDQAQAIPVLSDEGRTYLVFVLHPGGCEPVSLTASIEGHSASTVERSLDFACGE